MKSVAPDLPRSLEGFLDLSVLMPSTVRHPWRPVGPHEGTVRGLFRRARAEDGQTVRGCGAVQHRRTKAIWKLSAGKRAALCVAFLCVSAALRADDSDSLFLAAERNFITLKAIYNCPPSRAATFFGSGFALGSIGGKVLIATAAHVLYPTEAMLGNLPRAPSCSYRLDIEADGSSTISLTQQELEKYSILAPEATVPFRGTFLSARESTPQLDIALVVLPEASFDSAQAFAAFPTLCPFEDTKNYALYALMTGGGQVIRPSKVTGPHRGVPGNPPPPAPWYADDLVREGTSGSPLFAYISEPNCRSIALVGVVQSRATQTAAGAPTNETNNFNMALFPAFRLAQGRLAEAGVVDKWEFARALAFDGKVQEFVENWLANGEFLPATAAELVRLKNELKGPGRCHCATSINRWEGLIDLLARVVSLDSFQSAARELVAQFVIDQARSANGSVIAAWPESTERPGISEALASDLVAATSALTERMATASEFRVDVGIFGVGRVLASVCSEEGCADRNLKALAREELRVLDAADPGIRELVLERMKDALPP